MNLLHRWYCRSAGWRRAAHHGMLPWVLGEQDLGENVLEIGPGPGVTTDWLREHARSLTCIEVHTALATSLRARMEGTNPSTAPSGALRAGVIVVEGDATAMPFPDASFDCAVCFTMLHHVPSPELQDRLLAETCRVLKPGGLFAGSDSTPSVRWRLFHLFDTCVPVDPETFARRLSDAGLHDAEVDPRPEYNTFRFRARKAL